MTDIHLVTTKNINSWSKTKKNILLGGWCYDYKIKDKYRNYDFEIIKSPSLSFCERKNKNFAKRSQTIIEKEIKSFSIILNKIHNTNYSVKYWSVILSPWIGRFVSTVLIVQERLRIISSKYKINSVTFYENFQNFYLPKDYAEGCKLLAFDGIFFNKVLYEIIIQKYKNKKIQFIVCKNKFNFNQKDLRSIEGFSIKRFLKVLFFRLTNLIPLIENKPFIVGTVLPSISET